MTKNRKFYFDAFQHIYQKSVDSGVIFYTIDDYLVLFSIICTYSIKMAIDVICVCFMRNHFHICIDSTNKEKMSKYIMTVCSVFAKEYNRNIGRKGDLFKHCFGSASKSSPKTIRTCMAYIFNNPVEQKICNLAEDYRWNFLAYANNENPFSKHIIRTEMTASLRNCLDIIKAYKEDNQYLNYGIIKSIFKSINCGKNQKSIDEKKEFLIDNIITTFSTIRYDIVYKYFKNYNSLCLALSSMTGNEYEIKEERDRDSDNAYQEMINLTEDLDYLSARGNFAGLPEGKLNLLIRYLRSNSSANEKQIMRFLHL